MGLHLFPVQIGNTTLPVGNPAPVVPAEKLTFSILKPDATLNQAYYLQK